MAIVIIKLGLLALEWKICIRQTTTSAQQLANQG